MTVDVAKFCTQCGSEFRPGAAFCPGCGRPLGQPPQGRNIRWPIVGVIAAAVGALVVVGLVFKSAGGGSSDEAQLRQLFERGLQLFTNQDFAKGYDTYSPRAQAACPFDSYVAASTEGALSLAILGMDIDDVGYRDLEVDVQGDLAYLSYSVTYQNAVVDVVPPSDPDIFVKIDGRWYDEADDHTGC